MKRFLTILAISILGLTSSLSAQHYVGVRGGWGGGSARFFPQREMGYEWGLPSAGISYKFYSNTKYVGAIELDLQYMSRGFMYDFERKGDESYHRRVNSIDLPFMWQPHIYMFNRHARFFINLGVQFSYNIDSEYSIVSKQNGVLESGDYPLSLTRDNRLGYGLCGGAGFGVFIGRFELALEGRYYYGYSDILRNSTKYEGNPVRSPLDNINISAGLYYRLGKEGIRSAPSASYIKKELVREAKRAESLINKSEKQN